MNGNGNKQIREENKEYYLSTKDKNGYTDLIYSSEAYKFSEIEILNLIRLCIVDRRHIGIGNKLLLIYKDSTLHRIDLTSERLKKIGIKESNNEPTKSNKARYN